VIWCRDPDAPAQQRLRAHDALHAVHLGLVVQHELIVSNALPQRRLESGACGERGLHFRIKEAQRIASRRLCLVHGDVGMFQQFIHELPVSVNNATPMLGVL